MITEDRADRSWRPEPERYRDARYRRAGRSGLLLPPVPLGPWQDSGASSVAQLDADLDALDAPALEAGELAEIDRHAAPSGESLPV
ncbi:hypothetical protein [Kineococcus sp. SYSU DK006]|uniref:hypothetical protein n=1 Tax=Kineococcus sp. SYSU DK006 TaxID=3383127 RepID=UPI003D7CB03A